MNKVFEELKKWVLSALGLAVFLGTFYGIAILFQNYPTQCIGSIVGLCIVGIVRLAFFD